jgi:CO/xanthine dehydrogenase Mo-binding subunit
MCSEKTQKHSVKKLIFSNDFYSDLETEGMLYGAIVRCPFSTGVINSVTHPELPEGYYLFTVDDISGVNSIDTLEMQTPVFCNGKINYKGEPLGILVGPDEETVYNLLSEVKFGFDKTMIQTAVKTFEKSYDRPALTLAEELHQSDINAANKETHLPEHTIEPLIPPFTPNANESDILARRTVCTGAALLETKDGVNPFESLFSEADHVIQNTWTSTSMQTSYGETNGALCLIKNGMLTLYTPTQWLSHLRKAVSDVIKFDPEKILVCRTNSSSLNTNTLWRNATLSAQICLAVYRTGKPVKLVLSRDEQMQFMQNSAPVKIMHRTAVSKDGEITAMHVSVEVDAGAWNPFSSEILDRLVIASCGIYNPQNLKVEAVAKKSATPPSSVDLSTIDSQSFYAVENQMQRISEVTGIQPVDLRLKNIRLLSSKETSMPFLFSPGKMYETLDAVSRASDFSRKYAIYRLDEGDRYKRSNDSPFAPPFRGIGLSCAFSGSGYYGTKIYSGNHSLQVTYNGNDSLEIKTMPPSASIKRIWIKIASDILEIPPDAIILDTSFDEENEPQLPESINSNVSIMTQLLRKCCETVKAKKQTAVLPIVVKKEITPAQKKSWNDERFCGTPFHSTSFGAAVMEVELEPCTYREKIRGIWIAVDGGKILSTKAAETSIKLSIQQTLARLVEDESVKCDKVNVQFIQSDSDPKQIGDLIPSILPAAYTSALSQALASTVTMLPLKTDSLYEISVKAHREAAQKDSVTGRKNDQKPVQTQEDIQ